MVCKARVKTQIINMKIKETDDCGIDNIPTCLAFSGLFK